MLAAAVWKRRFRGAGVGLCRVLLACCAAGGARAAERMLLRDLTVLRDVRVAGFDEDGVRLADGRRVGWDEIERASLSGPEAERFARLLDELGDPLFRIRRRLQVGDDRGVLGPAEAVAARLAGRRSRAALWVQGALFRGRLAAGRREEAVEPYLRVRWLQGVLPPEEARLPGRPVAADPETGLSWELIPVWFDDQAARRALPGALEAAGQFAEPPPAAWIYTATLALGAGEAEAADRLLRAARSGPQPPAAADWLLVIEAQREAAAGRVGPSVRRLERRLGQLRGAARPAGCYWVGMAKTAAEDEAVRREGILDLLYVPALFGERTPQLSAAAISRAIAVLDQLGEAAGAAALRAELLDRYAAVRPSRLASPPKLRAGRAPGDTTGGESR